MRKVIASLAAIVLCLSLAACGGDPDDDVTVVDEGSVQQNSDPSTSTSIPAGVTLSGEVNERGQSAATGDEIEIVLNENYFEPTYISVEANKRYKVKLRNEGDGFHTFTVGTQNIDVPLPPGENAETELVAPASGSVEFVCTPHASMGMRGAIFVQ